MSMQGNIETMTTGGSLPKESKLSLTSGWTIVIGIILISLTMRSPITSVGPLLSSIREALVLSNTVAGLITALPLLAFCALSPFAPGLARRFGLERVLLYSLILLMIGFAVRLIPATVPLIGGTVLIGLAIAVFNVLLPSLVKRDFPLQVGIMTGVYTVSMNLCGALASGTSVPLARDVGLGWNGALGIWGVLVPITALFWFFQARSGRAAAGMKAGVLKRRSLWRSPLAWTVALFMGMQSLIFYVSIAWFPDMLTGRGLSDSSAGWMISLLQLSQLPVTFIVPIIAGRMKNQRLLVIIMAVLLFASLGGLYFGLGGNNLIPLWIIFLGIGGGSSFSLAMIFLTLRTKDAQDAASLSGMSQSVGYLLAASGPTLFGLLHDVTGGWNIPLLLLLGVSGLLFICGWGASQNRTV
ncbi:CynX/NimT family MFS transporter [Paenibacillus sp. YN15]|uniref:CynX/NimT family MFS transporter n=1 Tax=Paenibacillus sp. YN15 TaxID=1742774 RepID=UPI0026AFEB87